jgi:hypothetical protein
VGITPGIAAPSVVPGRPGRSAFGGGCHGAGTRWPAMRPCRWQVMDHPRAPGLLRSLVVSDDLRGQGGYGPTGLRGHDGRWPEGQPVSEEPSPCQSGAAVRLQGDCLTPSLTDSPTCPCRRRIRGEEGCSSDFPRYRPGVKYAAMARRERARCRVTWRVATAMSCPKMSITPVPDRIKPRRRTSRIPQGSERSVRTWRLRAYRKRPQSWLRNSITAFS